MIETDERELLEIAQEAAEAAIRKVLADRRPGDAILGEEGGASGDGELRWVIDPLDGTINFLFGIPAFAVSVACEDANGTLAGIVLDPIRQECFGATRSGPPRLNGEQIAPSGRDDMSTAMVATGFSYDSEVRARQGAVVARVLPRVRDIRRVGAAALDLSWCACGRFDAYYERGLHPWDLAAGGLVAREAGARVEGLHGEPASEALVLAAGPGVFDAVHDLLAPLRPDLGPPDDGSG